MARIPEQRTNSWASEVKTITEVGPSVGDFADSPQPGLPTEQRALLGSSGSHAKWPKPPAEKKAEVRAAEGECLPCLQSGQEWRGRDPCPGASALTARSCPPGEPLCGPAKREQPGHLRAVLAEDPAALSWEAPEGFLEEVELQQWIKKQWPRRQTAKAGGGGICLREAAAAGAAHRSKWKATRPCHPVPPSLQDALTLGPGQIPGSIGSLVPPGGQALMVEGAPAWHPGPAPW